MDRTIYDNYVKILRKELVPALGCTEPIALAYASAKAIGTGVHRADRFGLCIGKSKGSIRRVSRAYDSLVQREYHQECKRCEGS